MAAKEEAEAAATAAAARVTAAEHAMSTAKEQAMAQVRAAEEATRHTAGAVVLGSALCGSLSSLMPQCVCRMHWFHNMSDRGAHMCKMSAISKFRSRHPPWLASFTYARFEG